MFTRKDLIKLLAPLIVEQILAVLVGMADVVMVAAVGETAVSGVSLVDSISLLIIQLLAALATGGSVVCAQYLGKRSPDQACKAAGQLFLVTTLISVCHCRGGFGRKPSSAVSDLWAGGRRCYAKCHDLFPHFRIFLSVSGNI